MKDNQIDFFKKNSFRAFVIISLIFATINAEAKLTLQEIRSASKDVLVVFFTSDTLNLTEVDISNASEWKINGQPCKSIYRYSTKADMCDHHIYLQTTDLVEGREYEVITPYGRKKFKFDSRTIFCESIKTNQAAYSALSKVRYANFTIWLGTGGSRKINGRLPAWEVFNQATGKTIARGMLEEKGMDSTSGGFVYRIDLASVPEGGPYKIAVKGYGCSYPFGVGGEFMKRAAYITFRGQFYQRCGCPIDSPDIRKHACHTIIYDVDGPIGEANIVVQGNEPTFKCYGGYHDAGDADRRAYHISNPMINLMAYEAFPHIFFDGQFDIPGDFDSEYNIVNKKNRIPDIIDEAAWGTLIWEYLQNEDGSIHFGTETKGYPEPFAAPMDLDEKKYGTVRTDNRATCPAAGLFLHLARIIKPYNPEKSKELMIRADKAFSYGSSAMADPEKLYYHLQRYLLTRNETDHQKVKELYTIAGNLKNNLFGTVGYSLNDKLFDNPAYIFSYIVAKDVPTDPEIVSFFTSALKDAAETNITELRKRAFPVGNTPEKGGWGHNVRQNHFATASMLMWSLTGEQKYIDAASELLDYKMGLNPVGISYVTHLGFHQVHNPHDRESAYTASLGLGPKPGITVFGPGITGRRTTNIPVIPQISELPKERQYVDDRDIISFNEFTIFETLAHDAWYTVLANGGKWNGKDPFSF
ncbi:MAG TPA: glycoside hydrolase family 9 protein [Bacteroidales bacterium]|nr:glycoside hydrolase family 9 protein [Bacteroidales bacterium]